MSTRAVGGVIALCLLVGVACGSSDPETSGDSPVCGGTSQQGLTVEQTSAEECPSRPMQLTGTIPANSACTQSTDCAPVRCVCSGTSECGFVSECNNGSCLDDATACCLFALQCGE